MKTLRHLLLLILVTLISFHSQKISAQRQISDVARIFQNLRDGVFTIHGDSGQGSGFLIDKRGLILTNEHVVKESRYLRVQLNDSTKVKANLIVADIEHDIAVIRINSAFCNDLPVLPLSKEMDIIEGEPVLAIGSPLRQSNIVTSGIVSKVEKDAILSDVNINHGNSGGPLIYINGEVIGICTFGDFDTGGGPGISGIVKIDLAQNLIKRALESIEDSEEPPFDLLPVLPKTSFPRSALIEMAKEGNFNERDYLVTYESIKVSETDPSHDPTVPSYNVDSSPSLNFDIRCYTPPYQFYMNHRLEMLLSEKRKTRELTEGIEAQQRYLPLREYLRSWFKHTKWKNLPVVTFDIKPKIGETTSSFLSNLLLAGLAGYLGQTSYYRSYEYKYLADLNDFQVFRNDSLIVDMHRSVYFENLVFNSSNYAGRVSATDVAAHGIFMYSPEIFRPDSTGWPEIKIVIEDIESPDNPVSIILPEKQVEKMWMDFEPYRKTQVTK